MLETVGLRKEFYLGKEVIKAVDGVDLKIEKGEFLCIVGPSGCGKTTLLGLLGGLERPTEGEVILDGKKYSECNENLLSEMRRRKIGFVFQFLNLLPNLTAYENIILPMKLIKKGDAREKTKELLNLVGLSDRAKHKPSELSGGEQQRVAIVRALANDPDFILVDEPTGDLDTKTGKKIIDLLGKLNREKNQSFVVVSHDVKFKRYANRILKMKDGRIEG
ncbi:MAG: ABC transporter ATP-binding protein [Candidatus Methanofastidiosia archaeon]